MSPALGLVAVSALGFAPTTAGFQVLLDASNLQLSLRPGGATLGLTHLDVDHLPSRLDALSKSFSPAAACTAIFDGNAFDGEHAGKSWTCEEEVPDATPLNVRFTAKLSSADDELVQVAQEIGASAGSSSAEAVTSSHVRHALETLPLVDAPRATTRPVYAVTLLRSAMGKSKRDKREAFLKSCGLRKMGDTVHLPSFTATQQERSLALIRGLHTLERGVVRIDKLERPSAIVVSDDRGLRRRCHLLANPPVVLGRAQFFNWMEREQILSNPEEGPRAAA